MDGVSIPLLIVLTYIHSTNLTTDREFLSIRSEIYDYHDSLLVGSLNNLRPTRVEERLRVLGPYVSLSDLLTYSLDCL